MIVTDELKVCESIPGYSGQLMLQRLYDCAREAEPDGLNIEIGCLFGRSAVAIGWGLQHRYKGDRLVCVDPFESWEGEDALKNYQDQFREAHESLPEFFLMNVVDAGVTCVDLVVGKSQDESVQQQAIPDKQDVVRFAFIDGDHRPEQVRADTEWIMAHVVPGSIVAFDDYGHNRNKWDVAGAVDELVRPRARQLYEDEPAAMGCVFFEVTE